MWLSHCILFILVKNLVVSRISPVFGGCVLSLYGVALENGIDLSVEFCQNIINEVLNDRVSLIKI